jgi:hypothetical protein
MITDKYIIIVDTIIFRYQEKKDSIIPFEIVQIIALFYPLKEDLATVNSYENSTIIRTYTNIKAFLIDLLNTNLENSLIKKNNIPELFVFFTNWNLNSLLIYDSLLNIYASELSSLIKDITITYTNQDKCETISVIAGENVQTEKNVLFYINKQIVFSEIYHFQQIEESESLLRIMSYNTIPTITINELESEELLTYKKAEETLIKNSLRKLLEFILIHYKICQQLKINYFKVRTVASIATKYWHSTLTKKLDKKLIPIKDSNIYSFIRLAYRGGLCFCDENKYFKDIYAYDIKSQYPAMMFKNAFPIGTDNFSLIDFTETGWVEIKEFLKETKYQGFISCNIRMKKEIEPHLHLLRKRYFLDLYDESSLSIKNLLDLPDISSSLYYEKPQKDDTWTDVYCTNELLYADTLDFYDIKPIKGYIFKEINKNLFRNFVKSLYQYKENAKNQKEQLFYKLILNSLSGKLGINMTMRKFIQSASLQRQKTITFNNTSFVHLAAFITAYGRIHLHKILMSEHNLNNKIIYYHTDSIITTNKISEKYIYAKKENKFMRLGKFRATVSPLNEALFLTLNNYIIKKGGNSLTVLEKKGRYHTWNQFKKILNDRETNKLLVNDEENIDKIEIFDIKGMFSSLVRKHKVIIKQKLRKL